MLITFEQLKKAVEALRDFILARIPKRTSELINDSDFAVKSEVPTKTSDLVNDSEFTTIEETTDWLGLKVVDGILCAVYKEGE